MAEPKDTVEVTLAKPHTHAGRDYNPGDKIQVTDEERKWLADPKRAIIEDADRARRFETNVGAQTTGANVERQAETPGMTSAQGQPAAGQAVVAPRHSNPKGRA